MTADDYDIGGRSSPTDRTPSGDSPVVGDATGDEFTPAAPSERFDADRTADDRPTQRTETVDETPAPPHTEETFYV